MKRLAILLALAIWFGISTNAFAKGENLNIQRTITIQGTVKDVSGNPISGAEIRVINISDIPTFTAENGFYRMYRGINSGLIILRVSKPGYISVIKANIIVHADGPRIFTVDCVLESTP